MPTTILTQLKILVVFGSDTNINLNIDKQVIKKLEKKGAKITWLIQNKQKLITKKELQNHLSQESWNIFFFAGHS